MNESPILKGNFIEIMEGSFTLPFLINGNEAIQPIDLTKNLFCLGGEKEEIINSVFMPVIRQAASKGMRMIIIENNSRLSSEFAINPNVLTIDFDGGYAKNKVLERTDLDSKTIFILNFSDSKDYEPVKKIFEFLEASLNGPVLFLFSQLPVFAQSFFFRNIHLRANEKFFFVLYLEDFDNRNTYLTFDLIALGFHLLITCKYTLIGLSKNRHIFDFASKYTMMDINSLKTENIMPNNKGQYYFQSSEYIKGYFVTLSTLREDNQN